MNPIMAGNNLMNIIEAVRAGRLNPRQEVLGTISGMDSVGKRRLQQILPQIEKLARHSGVPDSEISATIQEISSRL